MDALLIKTGGLLLIVALGYLLKRRGVFQQGDARLLSRIIVNLTLPGALLSSFSAFRLVPSLLAVLAAAAAANVLLLAVSALVTRGRRARPGALPAQRPQLQHRHLCPALCAELSAAGHAAGRLHV
ncbi:MAG: hypothetical protein ACLTYN_05355 [Dysosmobacter welbionis]